MERSVVILGAAGFVGAAVTRAAVAAGYRVLAVVRSPGALEYVETSGAHPLRGDAAVPGAWIHATAGADALIDLTQPALPTRLTVRAMTRMAHQRLATTEALLGAFRTLPAERRPLWISVSGTDDLLPDARGVLSSASRPRQRPRGFAHIGLPVRAALAASGEAVAFVHFGQMVYGPGKAYAAVIAEGVRTGSARVIGRGDNRLPLTHVHDAAAALTHLVALDRAQLAGRTIVAAPASPDTQRDLFTLTARALGAPAPEACVDATRRARCRAGERRGDDARRAVRPGHPHRDGIRLPVCDACGGDPGDARRVARARRAPVAAPRVGGVREGRDRTRPSLDHQARASGTACDNARLPLNAMAPGVAHNRSATVGEFGVRRGSNLPRMAGAGHDPLRWNACRRIRQQYPGKFGMLGAHAPQRASLPGSGRASRLSQNAVRFRAGRDDGSGTFGC